jgi:hypothetical protein
MTFSSQYGQLGQLLFFLTGSPPRIASLPAFLVTPHQLLGRECIKPEISVIDAVCRTIGAGPFAGVLLDATAAREPADAAAINCRLVKSFLFTSISFHKGAGEIIIKEALIILEEVKKL